MWHGDQPMSPQGGHHLIPRGRENQRCISTEINENYGFKGVENCLILKDGHGRTLRGLRGSKSIYEKPHFKRFAANFFLKSLGDSPRIKNGS